MNITNKKDSIVVVRKINITIAIDDTDQAEDAVRKWFDANLEVVSIETLINTDHLKGDEKFKKLLKAKRVAQKNIYTYVDKSKKKKPVKTNYCKECFMQFDSYDKYIKHLNKNH